MALVAADRFPGTSLRSWWGEVNPHLLTDAPVVADGYVRARLTTGGAGGSFHFNANDGWLLRQWTLGDFDCCGDLQVFNHAETGLPATGGPARLFGLGCHSWPTPESIAGYTSRDYYHRVIGAVPGGNAGQVIGSEWKYTINASSTWNTFAGQDAETCRWWVRMRRVGNVFASWDAPRNGDAVPSESDWTNEHQITLNNMPPFVQVGLQIYSSTGSANVAGRCYAFLNTGL